MGNLSIAILRVAFYCLVIIWIVAMLVLFITGARASAHGVVVHVWNDFNDNGMQDGLEGNRVNFAIVLSSQTTDTVFSEVLMTGSNGNAEFGDLPDGDYVLNYEDTEGNIVTLLVTLPSATPLRIGLSPTPQLWLPVVER